MVDYCLFLLCLPIVCWVLVVHLIILELPLTTRGVCSPDG